MKTVNRHDPIITEALKSAPIYKKKVEVKARIAKESEKIITTLGNGKEETINTANPGDYIITNLGGEQYILIPKEFNKRYELKEGCSDIYVAKGHCKSIDNPWAEPIELMASWEEMQNGAADCKIADYYDPETKKLDGEPYIIGKKEFYDTYKLIKL